MSVETLTLVRLSPDHDVDRADALALAGQIADILNSDPGLPHGMRRPAHLPPETAEGVLSFTRQWCLERSARYFALVDGSNVVGMVTLSRIDAVARSARIGHVLATGHHGAESKALRLAVDLARDLGIAELSTGVSDSDPDPLPLWRSMVSQVHLRDGRLYASL